MILQLEAAVSLLFLQLSVWEIKAEEEGTDRHVPLLRIRKTHSVDSDILPTVHKVCIRERSM